LKPDRASRLEWVDRYVRDELSVEEIAAFELALLDSPEMQQELETTLALRQLLLFHYQKLNLPTIRVISNSLLEPPTSCSGT
jgi:hypothetical protein